MKSLLILNLLVIIVELLVVSSYSNAEPTPSVENPDKTPSSKSSEQNKIDSSDSNHDLSDRQKRDSQDTDGEFRNKRLRDFVGKRDSNSPIDIQLPEFDIEPVDSDSDVNPTRREKLINTLNNLILRYMKVKRNDDASIDAMGDSSMYSQQKRDDEIVHHGTINDYDKRVRDFVGKRVRDFVGKRVRDFVGKRTSSNANWPNDYIYQQKRIRDFVGKRSSTMYDLDGYEKRLRDLVGKRSGYDAAYLQPAKRLRDLVGKRSMYSEPASLVPFSNPLWRRFHPTRSKRIRDFVGKRSSDDTLPSEFGVPSTIIGSGQLARDLRLLEKYLNEQAYQLQSADITKSKRVRDFVGRR